MDLEEYKEKLINLGLSKIDIKEELKRYADELKDDINANRNSITDGLVNNGFTSQFVKELLDRLSPEEIYLASLHLPQIISRFSKMDKSRVRVNDVIRFIMLLDEDDSS